MWKNSLKLFRNEDSKVLLCTKALITIDWKWLKSTQKLAGSPLSGENYQLQPTLESSEYQNTYSRWWKYGQILNIITVNSSDSNNTLYRVLHYSAQICYHNRFMLDKSV